jgi:hypothetical protein
MTRCVRQWGFPLVPFRRPAGAERAGPGVGRAVDAPPRGLGSPGCRPPDRSRAPRHLQLLWDARTARPVYPWWRWRSTMAATSSALWVRRLAQVPAVPAGSAGRPAPPSPRHGPGDVVRAASSDSESRQAVPSFTIAPPFLYRRIAMTESRHRRVRAGRNQAAATGWVAAAGMTAVMLLAACGGKSGQQPTATPTPTAAAEASASGTSTCMSQFTTWCDGGGIADIPALTGAVTDFETSAVGASLGVLSDADVARLKMAAASLLAPPRGGRATRHHRACPASRPITRLRWPVLRRAHRAHWMP